MNDYSRNIAFTSATTDYELLTDINIKSAIKLRMGITSDSEYATLIANGISNIGFCVFSESRISINGESYANNESLFHVVAGDGEISSALIKSIKVEDNGVNGIFYFKIA